MDELLANQLEYFLRIVHMHFPFTSILKRYSRFVAWFQVLLHEGFLHCICHDLLFHVWCSCVLAHPTLLLDCTLCSHDEAPNRTHDQVQIHSVQHWETGELHILFDWFLPPLAQSFSEHVYFCLLIILALENWWYDHFNVHRSTAVRNHQRAAAPAVRTEPQKHGSF